MLYTLLHQLTNTIGFIMKIKRILISIIFVILMCFYSVPSNCQFFLKTTDLKTYNEGDLTNYDFSNGQAANQIQQVHVLDETIFNETNCNLFVIADIDGNGNDDIITFKNIEDHQESITIIFTYFWNGEKWVQKYEPFKLKIGGLTYLVDSGDFNGDNSEEIIIVNMNPQVYGAFLLDLNGTGHLNPLEIYSSNYFISDICVGSIDGCSSDKLYLLVNHFNISSLLLIDYIAEISILPNKTVDTRIIFCSNSEYWMHLTIGSFFEGNTNNKQLVLYQFLQYNSTVKSTKIKIVDFNNQIPNYFYEIDLAISNKPRDICAWDYDNDGRDELTILESTNHANNNGYISKISFIQIYQNVSILKSSEILNSKKLMKQFDVGNPLSNPFEELFILDPPGHPCRILLAFDDESQFWYAFPIINIGIWVITNLITWGVLTIIYHLNFYIDIILAESIGYDSDNTKDTSFDLLVDLILKVPTPTRILNYADVVMGMILDWKWDTYGGMATHVPPRHGPPARYCAVFLHTAPIMAHELGHCLGLYEEDEPNWHCPDITCIMHEFFGGLNFIFCSSCKDKIFRPICQANRDYTLPSPTVVSSGAHHHNDVGSWQISGNLPSDWTIKVHIDSVYQGDSMGTYNIPSSSGYHTLRVETYEPYSNIPHISENMVYVHPNRAPVADAGADITTTEGSVVQFNGYGSYDLDADYLTYSWKFSDTQTGTGSNPTHIYYTQGIYTVTLTVSDGHGGSDTDTLIVTVQDDDTISPNIIIDYLNGDNTDGNPGLWNVQILDPKQISYIKIVIDSTIQTEISNTLPSFTQNYAVPNALGPHTIEVYATDNDNSPASGSKSKSETINDDDTKHPSIEISYVGGGNDGNPGYFQWNIYDLDDGIGGDGDSGLSEIDITILYESTDGLSDMVIPVSSSEVGTWNLFPYLGKYTITIFARDNDDDRTLVIDSLTTEISVEQDVIDDDITNPILANFSIDDDFLNLYISLNALDDSSGDDLGIGKIDVFIDEDLITTYTPSPSEVLFEFEISNDWIMEIGTHEVNIEVWDADNDRLGDSLSSYITGTFDITLEETKQFVIWEIDQMNEAIQSSTDDCWRNPASNRKSTMNNKMFELKDLISLEEFEDTYDKLLHDIKPKLTGLKTDEYEEPWGNGVFPNPWVICGELQEELRILCNEILSHIKILINFC